MKILKTMLLIAIACYLLFSLYISRKVYLVVENSYNTFGEDNKYSDIVSDELFYNICMTDIRGGIEKGFTYEYKLRMPITLHWFTGARTFCWYDSGVYDQDGNLDRGGSDIGFMVSLELKNGKWIISDYLNPDPLPLIKYFKLQFEEKYGLS